MDKLDVNRFLNKCKLMYLITVIGSEVFVKTLELLYDYDKPMEEHLLNIYMRKSFKKFNGNEVKLLKDIKKNKKRLDYIDITLAFKLIRATTCLNSSISFVWSDRCPKNKRNRLEHLLFEYKQKRNEFVHTLHVLDMSDEDFEKAKDLNTKELCLIIEKSGDKAGLEDWQIERLKSKIVISPTDAICSKLVPDEVQNLPIKVKTMSLCMSSPFSKLSSQALPTIIQELKEKITKTSGLNFEDQETFEGIGKSNRYYWVYKLFSIKSLNTKEEANTFWKEVAIDLEENADECEENI